MFNSSTASHSASAVAVGYSPPICLKRATAVPAFINPMAVARSTAENRSATAFVAAGNPPPSPMPSRHRLTASMPNVAAIEALLALEGAQPAVAVDHV